MCCAASLLTPLPPLLAPCSGAPPKKARPEPGATSKAASNALDEAALLPAASAPAAVQRQQKATSRVGGEGKGRPEGRPGGKPGGAPGAAAGKLTKREADGDGGVKPTKSERASKGGGDKAAAKQAGSERPAKKETGERPPKKEVGERPVKKEAAPAERPAPIERPAKKERPDKGAAKPRSQPLANGRPAKPAAAAGGGKAAAAAVKQEAQQEHAGSNPTSMQREGGGAAAAEQRQQQATSPAQPAAPAVKAEPKLELKAEQGSSGLGTPVEVLLAHDEPAQAVGELVVAMYSGHSELWEAVRTRFAGGCRPARAPGAREWVQPEAGGWMLCQLVRLVRHVVQRASPVTMRPRHLLSAPQSACPRAGRAPPRCCAWCIRTRTATGCCCSPRRPGSCSSAPCASWWCRR